MKIKLIIAVLAASVLGGCVVVPEGHSHRGWHDSGWQGHHRWEREGYHHRRW